MGLSRRKFTKEFKIATLRQLNAGVSIAAVARSCEIDPRLVHRWRQDLQQSPVEQEPTVQMVRDGAEAAKGHDCVIGFGGGSAMDAAKAIAALASNSGEPLDYMEVVGKGKALEAK